MPWDVNQMNQLFMGQVLGNSPAESFDKGRTEAYNEAITRENNDAARQARQVALLRVQQKAQDQQLLQQKPTPENYQAYFLKYPEDREAAKEAWNSQSAQQQKSALTTLYNLKGYLQNGKQGEAYTHLRQRIEAEKAAGMDTADDEELLAHIVENPDGAVGVINGMLSMVSDPSKAPEGLSQIATAEKTNADTNLTVQTTPAKVQEAQAVADEATVKAENAPRVIESDLKTAEANRQKTSAEITDMVEKRKLGWAQLNLDQDKLETETQLKLEELHQKAGYLDAGATKVINDSVASAQQNYALADRAKSLADSFAATPMTGGWQATAVTAWKGFWGTQDGVSGLRQTYQALINSQAVKNLPPGPASDKDIQLAKQGFPPPNAGKDYIVSFLRGMEKMQRIAAQNDDRRANWIAANKSLAPAKTDLNVGGVLIPAGTTFNEFNNGQLKSGRTKEGPPRDYITMFGGGR